MKVGRLTGTRRSKSNISKQVTLESILQHPNVAEDWTLIDACNDLNVNCVIFASSHLFDETWDDFLRPQQWWERVFSPGLILTWQRKKYTVIHDNGEKLLVVPTHMIST